MKKALFLLLCCFFICTAFLNAQAEHSHWITASGGLRIGGVSFAWYAAELRYEYTLNPFFSVGAYAYYDYTYGTGIAGRWYPFSKSFFTELNAGYNVYLISQVDSGVIEAYHGIDIIPGFGWRIDIGKSGGFFITPSAKFPVIIRWYRNPYTPDPSVGVNLIGYFGLGYTF
jgi:hypothetical protein